MIKKFFDYGLVYFVIAGLFAMAAMVGNLSDAFAVLVSLWVCAVIFAVLGVLRLRKNFVKS